MKKIIFYKFLIVKGNEVAERLIYYMNKLNIKDTNDINESNLGTDKIV